MKKFRDFLNESLQPMEVFKAKDGKWYVGRKNSSGFVGPFDDLDSVEKNVFSSSSSMKNVDIDDSGRRPAPKDTSQNHKSGKLPQGPRRAQRGQAFFDLP